MTEAVFIASVWIIILQLAVIVLKRLLFARSSPRLWSACTFGCVYCNCWGTWSVCWLNDSWMMGSTDSHLCASNAHTHTFIQQTPLCTVWRQFQSLFISSPPLLYAHTLWCTFEKLPLCKGLIWFFVRRMSFIWATHERVHKSSRNAIDTLFILTPPLPFTHTSWWGLSIDYFPLLFLYSDKTFSIPYT